MTNILENLSKKLGIELKELKTKLGLNENSNENEIKNCLGVYSIFKTKQDHEKYLNKKISKKEEEITKFKEFETKYNDLDTKYKDLDVKNQKTKNYFETLIKNEWKNVSKEELNLEKLINSNIDFSNLRTSLVNFANQNNMNILDDNNKVISEFENQPKASKIVNGMAF